MIRLWMRPQQTLTFGLFLSISSVLCRDCLAAKRTDFCGLCWNALRPRSTVSSFVLSRPAPFLYNTESVVMKLVCHARMVDLDGGALPNRIELECLIFLDESCYTLCFLLCGPPALLQLAKLNRKKKYFVCCIITAEH